MKISRLLKSVLEGAIADLVSITSSNDDQVEFSILGNSATLSIDAAYFSQNKPRLNIGTNHVGEFAYGLRIDLGNVRIVSFTRESRLNAHRLAALRHSTPADVVVVEVAPN